jgi:hypothetical protein
MPEIGFLIASIPALIVLGYTSPSGAPPARASGKDLAARGVPRRPEGPSRRAPGRRAAAGPAVFSRRRPWPGSALPRQPARWLPPPARESPPPDRSPTGADSVSSASRAASPHQRQLIVKVALSMSPLPTVR